MIKNYHNPVDYCDCSFCAKEREKQKEKDKMVDKNKQVKDRPEVITK